MILDLGKKEPDAVFFITPSPLCMAYLVDIFKDCLTNWVIQSELAPSLFCDKGVTKAVVKDQLNARRRLAMRTGILGYVETSPSFIRIFSPYVAEVFPKYRVVHVLQDPLKCAVNLRSLMGKSPYPQSSSDDEIAGPKKVADHYKDWSPFQWYLHHVYECHARGFRLRDKLLLQDRYYALSLESVKSVGERRRLSRWLDSGAVSQQGVPFCGTVGDEVPHIGHIREYGDWYKGLDKDSQSRVDHVNQQFGVSDGYQTRV